MYAVGSLFVRGLAFRPAMPSIVELGLARNEFAPASDGGVLVRDCAQREYESPLSSPGAILEAHPTGGAMPRTWRLASPVVVTALLVVVASFPLRAIRPAILM